MYKIYHNQIVMIWYFGYLFFRLFSCLAISSWLLCYFRIFGFFSGFVVLHVLPRFWPSVLCSFWFGRVSCLTFKSPVSLVFYFPRVPCTFCLLLAFSLSSKLKQGISQFSSLV